MSIRKMIYAQIARLIMGARWELAPFRFWIMLFAMLGLALLAPLSDASADSPIAIPAEKFVIAPGGVDMRTGRFVYSQTDLSAGSDVNGITLNRIMPDSAARHGNPFGNFSHNWDIWLVETRVDLFTGYISAGPDYRMNVHIGGRSITFYSHKNDIGYSYKGGGAYSILEFAGDKASPLTGYTLRDSDGSIFIFRPIGTTSNSECVGNPSGWVRKRCAYISSLTRPDGTRFDFSYVATGNMIGNTVRLARVTSSRGFVLILEGVGNYVTKACVVNSSIAAPPLANTCPSNALASTTYAYTSFGTPATQRLASLTDAAGGIWGFSYSNPNGAVQMGFIKPGQTSPWLTNMLGTQGDEEGDVQEIVNSQSFADGSSYTYDYGLFPITNLHLYPTVMGGSYVDNQGNGVSIEYDFPIQPGTRNQPCFYAHCEEEMPDDFMNWIYLSTPGPARITDQLGRTTSFNYCDPIPAAGLPAWEIDRCIVIPLVDTTDPEGVKFDFKYDGNGNVIEVRRHAKPGSGLADMVVAATFNCAEKASCAKPVTSTDALGNVINRTYASGHGGVLTEMQPAPSVGGARPLKLTAWIQRYAWIKNASGTLVQAATPVWVIASETQCQTGAGSNSPVCDAAAQQSLVTYEYGVSGTAEALLVKGKAVTSGNVTLRTCFGYDSFSRRISETQPNANLSVCP